MFNDKNKSIMLRFEKVTHGSQSAQDTEKYKGFAWIKEWPCATFEVNKDKYQMDMSLIENQSNHWQEISERLAKRKPEKKVFVPSAVSFDSVAESDDWGPSGMSSETLDLDKLVCVFYSAREGGSLECTLVLVRYTPRWGSVQNAKRTASG